MDWVTHSKYSPEFEVLDSESTLGRYASMTKTITLKDLVKFHGHACDGLVQAAGAMSLALHELFPDGVIDRTDLRILSKNSPCFMDVSAYLTGGRINFGTLDVDDALVPLGINTLTFGHPCIAPAGSWRPRSTARVRLRPPKTSRSAHWRPKYVTVFMRRGT
jgi:hypothetical protein